jgi:hypothetical protein
VHGKQRGGPALALLPQNGSNDAIRSSSSAVDASA